VIFGVSFQIVARICCICTYFLLIEAEIIKQIRIFVIE